MPHDPHHDDHDLGFAHDLPRMIGRRRILALMGGIGLAGASGGAAAAMDCVALPWETAGPFPADGTNVRNGQVVNALSQAGVVREEMRSSFNGLRGVADGVPLTLELTLQNAEGCAPLFGHAIYLWQCDAAGAYSLYDLPDQNYLRAVGVADNNGVVRFTTIVPGCYPGRWPHFHFEIFTSPEDAVSGQASVLTAQIALPEAECAQVYASHSAYTNGIRNLGRLSLRRDGIFRDNTAAQLAQQTLSMRGNAGSAYAGTLTIPVDFNARR